MDPTCRNIDNGLVGGQNGFIGMQFTNRPADLDLYVGLVRKAMELFPGMKLFGCTSDFKSAYRQATANPDQAKYSVLAMWDPVRQAPCYAYATAQLFGNSMAPLNFCRIPDWCCFVMSRLLRIAAIHCIDILFLSNALPRFLQHTIVGEF